jgi:hypothetical protein
VPFPHTQPVSSVGRTSCHRRGATRKPTAKLLVRNKGELDLHDEHRTGKTETGAMVAELAKANYSQTNLIPALPVLPRRPILDYHNNYY